MVRMSNTYVYQGEDDVEQMIRDTKNGLFAAALGGGEVDTTTGNFTFGVREAYRIEDGKIGGPMRGANLVGNGPEIMKRIDLVGPELKFWAGTCGKGQWVPVSSGSPTLRISSMTVGGSGLGTRWSFVKVYTLPLGWSFTSDMSSFVLHFQHTRLMGY